MSLSQFKTRIAEDIAALDPFDASGWLGRTGEYPLMEDGSPELLHTIYRNAGINGALVSHWHGREYCPADANKLLLESLNGRDKWFATLTVQPLFPADPGLPGSEGWVWPEQARAARVFPASHKYSLVEWCAGSLCEMLVDLQVPLFVMHTETSFEEVYALARRFPELNIVLESQTKKILYHMRMILPLLKACPNVNLEMSNCCSQGMIEYICENIGPSQLVLGTFSPACDPLVPLGLIAQARISEEAKKMIAGGNIRRIIAEVRS